MLGGRIIAAAAVGLAACAPLTAAGATAPSVLVTLAPAEAPEVLGAGATPALPPASVARLERRAGRALPELRRVFRLDAADTADARRVAGRLDARPGIAAEVAPTAAPPPAICRDTPPSGWPTFAAAVPTPDLSALQDYRDGLDLPDGAAGAGVRVADVEYDWRGSHEELADRALEPSVLPPGGLAGAFLAEEHGTAVLGILGADADASGITGLVHQAAIRPVSPFHRDAPETYDLLRTTLDAALGLRRGDVLLIEQQTRVPTSSGTALAPVEFTPAVRDLIRAIVDAGVVVVEPAGNGGRDLAAFERPWLADPSHPDASGAILVGAGGSAATGFDLARSPVSNYGPRVDVQGYGAGVLTAGYGQGLGPSEPADRRYTVCFDGTSSASATVAGAVAALQGLAVVAAGAPLAPSAVRGLLVATGTPQAAPTAEPIGPRPQVAAAAALIEPAGPAAGAAPPAPAPAVAPAGGPPRTAPTRPAARGAGVRLDRRAGTLTIFLRGLAPRAVVFVAGRRVRVARGRVVLDAFRPRRLVLVVSAPPSRRAVYAVARFRVTVPARGPARVVRL